MTKIIVTNRSIFCFAIVLCWENPLFLYCWYLTSSREIFLIPYHWLTYMSKINFLSPFCHLCLMSSAPSLFLYPNLVYHPFQQLFYPFCFYCQIYPSSPSNQDTHDEYFIFYWHALMTCQSCLVFSISYCKMVRLMKWN